MEGKRAFSNLRNLKRYGLLLLPVGCLCAFLLLHHYIWSAATTGCCLLLVMRVKADERCYVDGALLTGAFALSMLGDRMLGYVSGGFLYGVAFFFGAHICYLLFCLRHGRVAKKLLVVLTVVYLVYYVMGLYPTIEKPSMRVAVLLYLLVSCLSFSAAWGLELSKRCRNLFVGGIACLVFSDTLISLHNYLGVSIGYFLMLPTYYASQILITAAVMENKNIKNEVV